MPANPEDPVYIESPPGGWCDKCGAVVAAAAAARSAHARWHAERAELEARLLAAHSGP